MSSFDINNINTWEKATDNEFVWKGEFTFFDSSTNGNITEKTMVLQLKTIFSALEQKVTKERYEKYNKNEMINCILDNFTKGNSPKDIFPVLMIMMEKGFSQSTAEEILLKYDNTEQINNKHIASSEKKLTITNENVLEGTTWKDIYISQYDEKVFGVMSIHELRTGGELVRNVITPRTTLEYPFESKLETTKYIDTWSCEGDIVKATFSDTLFEGKYYSQNNKIIEKKYFSNGKTSDETWEPYEEGDIEKFIQMLRKGKQDEQKTAYQDVRNTSSFDLTPPSKIPLFLGIVLLIGGFISFFYFIVRGNYDEFSSIIISIIVIICSLPFFIKYSSEKSKYFYKVVVSEMSQWVCRSSNDLIIQWGAPTKTYKFPSDKTMTVLEYKDSIRNYIGMRSKMGSGSVIAMQAKTTKYIKSFFVKDGVVVNYKYAIT